MPPRGHSPIDGFRVGAVEWWNSTSQIMEWPGTVRLVALWIALLLLNGWKILLTPSYNHYWWYLHLTYLVFLHLCVFHYFIASNVQSTYNTFDSTHIQVKFIELNEFNKILKGNLDYRSWTFLHKWFIQTLFRKVTSKVFAGFRIITSNDCPFGCQIISLAHLF